MSKLEDIEKAVSTLSAEERAKLRAWLDELDEQAFDDQIERDAKAGKLDQLEQRALSNLAAGRVRDL
ncbi:MAG: hypothetical protein CTY20_11770 [Hyphomicrobium sp.]|nr:MAG: hypothetical protein CTY20_11770 [Hyphomicrobium sp.]